MTIGICWDTNFFIRLCDIQSDFSNQIFEKIDILPLIKHNYCLDFWNFCFHLVRLTKVLITPFCMTIFSFSFLISVLDIKEAIYLFYLFNPKFISQFDLLCELLFWLFLYFEGANLLFSLLETNFRCS